jgi:O-antigen ligase
MIKKNFTITILFVFILFSNELYANAYFKSVGNWDTWKGGVLGFANVLISIAASINVLNVIKSMALGESDAKRKIGGFVVFIILWWLFNEVMS